MYPPLRLMFGWLPDACQHYLVLGKFPSLLTPSTCCCCCLKLTHCSTRHRLDPLLALNGTCESPYIAQKSTLGVMLVDGQLGLGSRMWARWVESTHPPQLKMVVSTMAFASMAAWYHLPVPHGGVKHLESVSSRKPMANGRSAAGPWYRGECHRRADGGTRPRDPRRGRDRASKDQEGVAREGTAQQA